MFRTSLCIRFKRRYETVLVRRNRCQGSTLFTSFNFHASARCADQAVEKQRSRFDETDYLLNHSFWRLGMTDFLLKFGKIHSFWRVGMTDFCYCFLLGMAGCRLGTGLFSGTSLRR